MANGYGTACGSKRVVLATVPARLSRAVLYLDYSGLSVVVVTRIEPNGLCFGVQVDDLQKFRLD